MKTSKKITLKDYIRKELEAHIPGESVEFTVHLNPDCTVASEPTGNVVRFTICVNGDNRYDLTR